MTSRHHNPSSTGAVAPAAPAAPAADFAASQLPRDRSALRLLAGIALTSALAGGLASTMTACGGGGGGGSPAPAPAPTPAPAPASGASGGSSTDAVAPAPSPGSLAPANTGRIRDAQGNIVASNYAAGSIRASAFSEINAIRTGCGFPALTQNSQLDTAAQGHVDYLVPNNRAGHFQTPGEPGFTGARLEDRVVAAGYRLSLAVENELGGRGTGAKQVRDFLSLPYHGLGQVNPQVVEYGIGVFGDESGMRFVTVSGAHQSGQPAVPVQAGLLTYPCAGVGNARAGMTAPENPTPRVANGAETLKAFLGTPILLWAPKGQQLVIQSGEIRRVTGAGAGPDFAGGVLGEPLAVTLNDAVDSDGPGPDAADPNLQNSRVGNVSSGYIAPLQVLANDSVYQVKFQALVGQQVVTREFRFKTSVVNE